MREKMMRLIDLLPEGLICSAQWLREQGYSNQLVKKYMDRGWLNPVGRGAYYRKGRKPQWQDVVLSLEKLWNKKVHIGALTALELQGLAHYLRIGKETPVYLYIDGDTRLPAWVGNLHLGQQFKTAGNNLFDKVNTAETIIDYPYARQEMPLSVSCRERAVLEMLDKVPYEFSFDHADKVMEGLFELRPDIVRYLLLRCRSVKTKRLFLFLAEKNKLPVSERLDIQSFSLGEGNRSIVKNGTLDKKYRITVPKEDVWH